MLEIDLASVIPPQMIQTFSETTLRNIARDVAEAARARWIRLSMDRLHTSQQEYTKGISGVFAEGDVAWVQLVGVFPNMIEQGFNPFDLRDTLLGPNVPVAEGGGKGKHQAKDGGFYRSISFRMMGSRASGRNAQRTTDVYASYLGEARAKKLGKLAEREMKKLSATLSNPGEKTQWGERLKTSGTPLDVLGRSHALKKGAGGTTELVRHGGPAHKTPIFEGASRFEQTYGKATQNTYGTFRTISTNVPEGWIHPGHQPGAGLAELAHEHALKTAADVFRAMVGGKAT